jgi:hypothetical protein
MLQVHASSFLRDEEFSSSRGATLGSMGSSPATSQMAWILAGRRSGSCGWCGLANPVTGQVDETRCGVQKRRTKAMRSTILADTATFLVHGDFPRQNYFRHDWSHLIASVCRGALSCGVATLQYFVARLEIPKFRNSDLKIEMQDYSDLVIGISACRGKDCSERDEQECKAQLKLAIPAKTQA